MTCTLPNTFRIFGLIIPLLYICLNIQVVFNSMLFNILDRVLIKGICQKKFLSLSRFHRFCVVIPLWMIFLLFPYFKY